MTSLRSRVVEAGARAIDDEIGAELEEHLAHILRKWPDTIESLAELALDAMLDVLAENVPEWVDAARKLSPYKDSLSPIPSDAEALIHALLREDR